MMVMRQEQKLLIEGSLMVKGTTESDAVQVALSLSKACHFALLSLLVLILSMYKSDDKGDASAEPQILVDKSNQVTQTEVE